MTAASSIVDDLQAESDALDSLVAELPAQSWKLATPAPGWTIAHQIGHLLWTDRVALTSITDEAGFSELLTVAQQNRGRRGVGGRATRGVAGRVAAHP
jgi:uncharacterized protein (TIGR03083 family)